MEEQILTLNKFGFNIVQFINPIDNSSEYYIYDSFSPDSYLGTQIRTFKHDVRGKNVTRFLSERSTALHLNTSNMEENTLRTHIGALKTVSRHYSSHYLFINYLAG